MFNKKEKKIQEKNLDTRDYYVSQYETYDAWNKTFMIKLLHHTVLGLNFIGYIAKDTTINQFAKDTGDEGIQKFLFSNENEAKKVFGDSVNNIKKADTFRNHIRFLNSRLAEDIIMGE